MPKKDSSVKIFYHDIGMYLKRNEKFDRVRNYKSIINPDLNWDILVPDQYGDWLNQRNQLFEDFIPLGDKKDKIDKSYFENNYSYGILSNRDTWVWNFSKNKLSDNIKLTINFYNKEREGFYKARQENNLLEVKDFITYDSTKITWDLRKFKGGLQKNHVINYDKSSLNIGYYRPFCKQWIYFNKDLNHSLFKQPLLDRKSVV